MKKFYVCIGALMLCFPFIVYAADSPPPGFIRDYPGMAAWAFGILLFGALTVVGWFVKSMDKNNREMWRHINSHAREIGDVRESLAGLHAQHDINHSGGRRGYDPPKRIFEDYPQIDE